VGANALAAPMKAPRTPLFALAIAAANRKDDVRLSGSLAKLIDEDPGLTVTNDPENHQILVAGQGEGHVRLAIERLKRRYGVDVSVEAPRTAYRETISAGATQRGRHKKQTGGHGQFADVTIEIKPRPRGSGFTFTSKITGGAVPRQWIPAVEQGVKDGMTKGPLGFPVVDLEVILLDGSFHPVDSSEMAFRIAGRIAIEEGLAKCNSKLLEPVDRLGVFVPTSAMSSVNSALSSRRGQILGFGPREGWPGWERIEANLPASERHDLIAELRSLSQGLGSYEANFDHMAELTGRLAQEVSKAAAE
jgi:elongation factor G